MHQLLNSGSAKILSTTNNFSQPEPSACPGEAKNSANVVHMPAHASADIKLNNLLYFQP
jgi:hypothetical protein